MCSDDNTKFKILKKISTSLFHLLLLEKLYIQILNSKFLKKIPKFEAVVFIYLDFEHFVNWCPVPGILKTFTNISTAKVLIWFLFCRKSEVPTSED